VNADFRPQVTPIPTFIPKPCGFVKVIIANTIFDGPTNFLDSARIYGEGRSEERLGAVLRERGGLPAGFVLSTKIDRDPITGVFDAAQARRSLEASLRILGRERFDLLYLHDIEHARSLTEATSRDGALGELFRIKEAGLAKAVGLAAGRVEMMMPLLRDWDFDAVMTHNRFTLVNRNSEPLLDLAMAKGIAVMNATPYASGVLAKGSVACPHYALSGSGRRCAGPYPPARSDRGALSRSARRGGLAVLAARQARHVDGVRRHQAGARERDAGVGALADSRGVLAGSREPPVRYRRSGGDAHASEKLKETRMRPAL
jgi:aryl-alcohol dehydrogenase-like predicted oxidoreductase